MIVAYLSGGAHHDVVARRILVAHEIRRLADVSELEDGLKHCDVLLIGAEAPASFRASLADLPTASFARARTVIDQTVADPDETRALATKLAAAGVALIDAPLYCETEDLEVDASAILCGGPGADVERCRKLLEAICPRVIHFGASGSGHTARLLVGAVAACNRMITYECATLGVKNGLSVANMALVLNKSSGANSASERVLPKLGTGLRTTHLPLASVTQELRMTSQLAMKAGTPGMLANLIGDLCHSLVSRVAYDGTFDDAVHAIESSAGIAFAPANSEAKR